MASTDFDFERLIFGEDSDYTSGEEEEDEEKYHPYEDREELVRSRPALGLSVDYVPVWSPRDAFREFFQNWKDAIIETFNLRAEDFSVNVTETGELYVAEARHPDSGVLLGFIRYIEKDGTIELTNFKASLRREALEVGATSKRQNNQLAGTHGEGFKIGALVMVRSGYQTRFETSRFYWRFQLGGRSGRNLYCGLTPISDKKLEKQKHAYALKLENGKPRELKNNIWEDVSVKIGRVHGPKWGTRISRRHFDRWLKVAIDLHGTSNIIKTAHGSLILDEKFSDKIFLKGLLLQGQSRGRKFKYGYDTFHGTVGRDRTKLEDESEELSMLANIWGGAIAIREKDCVPKYVEMLWEQQEWADVSKAQARMSSNTVRAIWDYLQVESAGKDQFYHDDRHGDTDIDLIRKSLKKEPIQLPCCIWEPLRRFNHVRTPQEQRHHLLHNAPEAADISTVYASMVKRALQAALCLDPRTQRLEIVFKDGAVAELDLLLEGTQLMINEKWLDFHASHKEMPCWLSRLSAIEGSNCDNFSCDHIITELYDMILLELDECHTGQEDTIMETDGLLRLRLVENLRQMPRLVEAAPGSSSGEIYVTWMYAESDLVAKLHGLDVKCRVILHRESTCAAARYDLVAPDNLSSDEAEFENPWGISQCGCLQQVVSQNDVKVTFRSLDYEELYFPMVSRTHAKAFYPVLLPSTGIRPRGPEASTAGPFGGSHTRISDSPMLTPPKHEANLDVSGDLYDASSADESDQIHGAPSPSMSTIEVIPARSGPITPPPASCTSQRSGQNVSKSHEIKELKRQLDKAIKDLSIKSQLVQNGQANISILQRKIGEEQSNHAKSKEMITQLISEKQILEVELNSTALLQRDKMELYNQLLSKYKEIEEQNSKLESRHLLAQEMLDRSKQRDLAIQDYSKLLDSLRHKDPINYKIFADLPRQMLSSTLKVQHEEREAYKQLKAASNKQHLIIQSQHRQVQDSSAELEKLRILHEIVDKGLREAKASEKNLQENTAQVEHDLAQSKAKNDELQENLDQMQSDLTNSLQTAARLSSRLYSPRIVLKRERVKEEDVSTPAPSPRRSEKRPRYESLNGRASNPALDPIMLD